MVSFIQLQHCFFSNLTLYPREYLLFLGSELSMRWQGSWTHGRRRTLRFFPGAVWSDHWSGEGLGWLRVEFGLQQSGPLQTRLFRTDPHTFSRASHLWAEYQVNSFFHRNVFKDDFSFKVSLIEFPDMTDEVYSVKHDTALDMWLHWAFLTNR